MSDKSPAEKARVKPGARVAVVNEVAGVVGSLGLPEDATFVDVEAAEMVLLFARERSDLESLMEPTAGRLATGASLWVLFRKGAAAKGLDMTRDDVWAVAERLGMRPLGIISVDDTWSVFRLRHG